MGSRECGRPKTKSQCARWRDADRISISTWRSCHGLDVSDVGHRLVSLGHLALPSCGVAAGRFLFAFPRHCSRGHGLVHDRLSGIESRIFRKIMRKRAPTARAAACSATDVVLFEQRLVTRLVLVLQVIEK